MQIILDEEDCDVLDAVHKSKDGTLAQIKAHLIGEYDDDMILSTIAALTIVGLVRTQIHNKAILNWFLTEEGCKKLPDCES